MRRQFRSACSGVGKRWHAAYRSIHPLISDRISIAGCSYPLAADHSIGIGALLARNRPQRLGFIRMIRPAKYGYTARLVRLQPYDRNKIPVLMTHGLQDTPATWAPLLNELRTDPQIDRHRFLLKRYTSIFFYLGTFF